MIRLRELMLGCLAGAAWVVPSPGLAASDSYSSGFYTRGVDAAAYIDQGGAVIDPYYVPVQDAALLPRVSLTVMQEDNIFLDANDPQEGTTVALEPGLLGIWGRPGGNHLYADYGAILPLYESVEELDDGPSHMLRLGSVYRTGKSQVQGEFGYRLLDEMDTVVGARVGKQDLLGDLNVEHEVTGKSSVGAEGRVEMHDYDEATYGDYNRYYGAGRLYHRLTPKSQAFFQGGLGRDDSREAAFAENSADFYDLSLGVRGKQSPKFNASGRVGYMWRTYDDETRADEGDWIASLHAESNPFGLTTFGGELYADIRPAIDANGSDVIDQGVVGTASRRLFIERLRGNAAITYGRTSYSTLQTATTGENEFIYDGRTDNYWGFSLGVDWWTRERFSLGLAYSYMNRDGSQNGNPEEQASTSYEYGRWTLRASWNY